MTAESDYESESTEASIHTDSTECVQTEEVVNIQRRDNQSRVTCNRMTKYEKAYILGVRANQLSMNAQPLVEFGNETDAYEIAVLELKEKKIPFIIRRRLPDNTFEDWRVSEMEIQW